MNKALGEIPVTVKLRTGVKDGRNNAHKLMPRVARDGDTLRIVLPGDPLYDGAAAHLDARPEDRL